MQRKQWFAGGVVSLVFFALNSYLFMQGTTGGGPPVGDNYIFWLILQSQTMSLSEMFGMAAIIFLVCGFLEKKD